MCYDRVFFKCVYCFSMFFLSVVYIVFNCYSYLTFCKCSSWKLRKSCGQSAYLADKLLFLHHSEAFAYINMSVFPSLSLMAANCPEGSFLQCLFFVFNLFFFYLSRLVITPLIGHKKQIDSYHKCYSTWCHSNSNYVILVSKTLQNILQCLKKYT